MAELETWCGLPRTAPTSPPLSLLATERGLWAGGIGAIAWRGAAGGWESRGDGLALRSVAAIAGVGGDLLAAGAGGIARSADQGATWRLIEPTRHMNVSCLAVSPAYGEDHVILAGTFDHGIARSNTGGSVWTAVNFGLRSTEITSLFWVGGGVVLAGTSTGIACSTNEGRAWRHPMATPTAPVIALDRCEQGPIVALFLNGELWSSRDDGESWSPTGQLPHSYEPQALCCLSDGALLVATVSDGVVRTDDGSTWMTCLDDSVFSFVRCASVVYSGGEQGVWEYASSSRTWNSLGEPPLYDLRRIRARAGEIYVWGILAPLKRLLDGRWSEFESGPGPIRDVAFGWTGELLVSTPEGLFASLDRGETWRQLLAEPSADRIAVREDGSGWVASDDGTQLFRTADRGESWSAVPVQFGRQSVVALQALPSPIAGYSLLAATYDEHNQVATLWRSTDDGETWVRGSDAPSNWPTVATLGQPVVVTVGSSLLIAAADGSWTRQQMGGNVRRVVGAGKALAVLTTAGISIRTGHIGVWTSLDDLPVERLVDIDLDGPELVVLLTDGEVVTRRLA